RGDVLNGADDRLLEQRACRQFGDEVVDYTSVGTTSVSALRIRGGGRRDALERASREREFVRARPGRRLFQEQAYGAGRRRKHLVVVVHGEPAPLHPQVDSPGLELPAVVVREDGQQHLVLDRRVRGIPVHVEVVGVSAQIGRASCRERV